MSIQKNLSGISTIYKNNLYSENQINTYDISSNNIIVYNAPFSDYHLINNLYVDNLFNSLPTRVETISGNFYFIVVNDELYFYKSLLTAGSLISDGIIFSYSNIIGSNIKETNSTDIENLQNLLNCITKDDTSGTYTITSGYTILTDNINLMQNNVNDLLLLPNDIFPIQSDIFTIQDNLSTNYYNVAYVNSNFHTKTYVNSNFYTKSYALNNYYTKSDSNLTF